jgi:rod shape-determining protein MreD
MRPADLTPVSRDALRAPARPVVIVLSFVLALLFNFLPWSGWALAMRPDWVLLLLVFWALHAPRAVGQGLAFALGLAMDVGDSMLLGQHALAYVVATFGAQALRVRVLAFGLGEQTLHVLGLFAVATALTAVSNALAGGSYPGWLVLLAPATTALCWAPIAAALLSPRLRRRASDPA